MPMIHATRFLPSFTLGNARLLVEAAGHLVSAATFESERMIYACSVRTSGPATLGHPSFEVHYNTGTGWLTMSGASVHGVDYLLGQVCEREAVQCEGSAAA